MKRNEKIELSLTNEEFRIMFYALNELRNSALNQGIDSIDIDKLMIKISKAPKKKRIISKILSRKTDDEPKEESW